MRTVGELLAFLENIPPETKLFTMGVDCAGYGDSFGEFNECAYFPKLNALWLAYRDNSDNYLAPMDEETLENIIGFVANYEKNKASK